MEEMRTAIVRHIGETRRAKASGREKELGPWGRGLLGAARSGRTARASVIQKMREEFEALAPKYLDL
jgi:malonyl-S-ACP:biotin-protein carboxyltransferase subunit MadD